jgi:nucleotide-binding universal stress UspA family protein
MRIVVLFDGSDDGFAGVSLLAKTVGGSGERPEFILTMIGWPVRLSPIWDRAFERQRAVDDLHRAMAEVAHEELDRLRRAFEPFGTVRCEYLEGEPIPQVVALIERVKPELLLCGLTRGPHLREVNAAFVGILERTSVPAITAFGASS